jgi:ABC-2 type transport system permease protein
MGVIWKLRAFVKRDLAIDFSYRLSFALEAVHVLIAVAAFYFLAQLVGQQRPGGYASFPFILVGLAVNAYMMTCFICFSQAIRGGQPAATLKAMLATPTSPGIFLLCSSLYPFIRASADAGAYLTIGVLFGLPLWHVNAVAATLVFVLSLLAFSSIGIMSATFTLLFKRGDPLLWLFGSGSWLLGGVLYPVGVLPASLQHVSTLLPITHAASGMRAALLGGASPAMIWGDLRALALFGLVGFPASVLLFKLGIDHAKRAGTLDHR